MQALQDVEYVGLDYRLCASLWRVSTDLLGEAMFASSQLWNRRRSGTEAVVSLVRAAIVIICMAGDPYWPPCARYGIILTRDVFP